jgi:hypothetical protein
LLGAGKPAVPGPFRSIKVGTAMALLPKTNKNMKSWGTDNIGTVLESLDGSFL